MNIKQWDRTVNRYAVEFVKLSRFTSKLVEDEENKANHFQKGPRREIRKYLMSQQFDTYSQVLTAARRVEIEIEDDGKNRT